MLRQKENAKIMKQLLGLARGGCTRDIALPPFHHTCAVALVLTVSEIWNIHIFSLTRDKREEAETGNA